MRAARSERTSNAEARQIKAACTALGIEGLELVEIFGWLDYCRDDGTPFRPDHIKRIW